MENKLKVGITHGDINGISYELIIKILAENKINDICIPVLYGSSKVAGYYRKLMDIQNFNLNSIRTPADANEKRSNIINCIDDEVKVEVGKETEESDNAAVKALSHALDDLNDQGLHVLTLAPQTDSVYKKLGNNNFISFFSKKYETKNIMPLLVGEKMKMGFVAFQTPFSEVSGFVTTENIVRKLTLLDRTLREDFTIRKPRIAVLSLNPSNGTEGFYGPEENEIIHPAIEQARKKGIMALGPYAADKIFTGLDYEKFDAILALHDEQGLVPFKAIEGYNGSMYLAGLAPIITLTVNGNGYDIAGKGVAEESGLRNAIYLGVDIYRNRKLYKQISGNPLPHYDIAGNPNESEMNVEQIAGVKEDF